MGSNMICFIFQPITGPPPVIHVTKGPIIQEITVYMDMVQHTVRLYNSSGKRFISCVMRNLPFGFLSRSDTSRSEQPEKMARDLKFQI